MSACAIGMVAASTAEGHSLARDAVRVRVIAR